MILYEVWNIYRLISRGVDTSPPESCRFLFPMFQMLPFPVFDFQRVSNSLPFSVSDIEIHCRFQFLENKTASLGVSCLPPYGRSLTKNKRNHSHFKLKKLILCKKTWAHLKKVKHPLHITIFRLGIKF